MPQFCILICICIYLFVCYYLCTTGYASGKKKKNSHHEKIARNWSGKNTSLCLHWFGLYFKNLQPITFAVGISGNFSFLYFFSLFTAIFILSPLWQSFSVWMDKSGKSGAEQVNCPQHRSAYATLVRLECPSVRLLVQFETGHFLWWTLRK